MRDALYAMRARCRSRGSPSLASGREQQIGGHGEQRGHGTAFSLYRALVALRALPATFVEARREGRDAPLDVSLTGRSRFLDSLRSLGMTTRASLARNDKAGCARSE